MAIFRTLATAGLLSLAATAAHADRTIYLNDTPLIRAGAAALAQGEVDRAIRLTERGLDQTARPALRAQGSATLCIAYSLAGKAERALAACDAAVALSPRDWRAYVNRGAVRYDLSDYAGAVADYRTADRLKPGTAAVAENLALAQAALEGRALAHAQ